MPEPDGHFLRGDTRDRTRRDVDRFRHRQQAGQFWHSLALVGSVGWPIVLLATGGAMLGRYLDVRLGTGIHLSLMILTVGTVLGCLIAYRTLRGKGS